MNKKNPKLDKYIVLEEHIKAVQLSAEEHNTVLCIQNTTELDYSTRAQSKVCLHKKFTSSILLEFKVSTFFYKTFSRVSFVLLKYFFLV